MNSNKKVFAFLIHSLSPGGMERVLTELANYFSESDNISVNIVMFGRSPEIFYDLNERIIIHKPKDDFNNRLRLFETIKRMLFIRKKVKQLDPDCVLSFGIHWNNFVLLSLSGLSYPVFVSDRGSPVRQFSFVHELLRKVLYRKAAGIVSQTGVARDIMRKIVPDSNIEVIGNPIRHIESSDWGENRENIILSVGRLISTKHHDRLIRIFSKLHAPGWKLVIVGGDALKQTNLVRLHQLLAELDLTDRVILAGEQKNVDGHYIKSRIFAFTSSVEGFPNVVGEALSAGLPVVSYDCIAGPSEMIIDGENGFLVPVFDDDLFQERLQHLIDDQIILQRMSSAASKSVKKFSTEEIAAKYYSFLTSKPLPLAH